MNLPTLDELAAIYTYEIAERDIPFHTIAINATGRYDRQRRLRIDEFIFFVVCMKLYQAGFGRTARQLVVERFMSEIITTVERALRNKAVWGDTYKTTLDPNTGQLASLETDDTLPFTLNLEKVNNRWLRLDGPRSDGRRWVLDPTGEEIRHLGNIQVEDRLVLHLNVIWDEAVRRLKQYREKRPDGESNAAACGGAVE